VTSLTSWCRFSTFSGFGPLYPRGYKGPLAKEGNRPAKRCVDGHLRRCVLSDQVKELSVISAGAELRWVIRAGSPLESIKQAAVFFG
jgi:hypothetical protein